MIIDKQQQLCEAMPRGIDVPSDDISTAIDLLKGLLDPLGRIAEDSELSADRLQKLVEECRTHFSQLKGIMEAHQNADARDGAETEKEVETSEARMAIVVLITEVGERLQQSIRQLASRKKAIAKDLECLRRTQHATRAYYGIKPPSRHPGLP